MKPGIIRASSRERDREVRKWMQSNGVRHHVPQNATIIIHGNWFEVDTFDIERVGQRRKSWALHRWVTDHHGARSLPIKRRRYRIRNHTI